MSSKGAPRTKPPSSPRYEFQKVIGAGGAGTVYQAFDRQTDSPVAIKVLHAKLSDNPNVHRRLAVEFRAASALEHPNIVRALAIENDGETSFLVYELVDAKSIGDWIDTNGKMPEDMAIRVAAQVAQALHYAHGKQVVHRDVKPDNILLLPDGRVKLTDFGLAKDYGNESMDLTRPMSGLGTPHFMAPEQFSEAKTADVRCDVYSLGATLYNMLTNRYPFDAKVPITILTNKELLKLAPIRDIAPLVSERADAAVFAALNPKPDRRPANCLEFFRLFAGRPGDAAETPVETVTAPEDDRRNSARFGFVVGSVAVVNTDLHNGKGSQEEHWPLVVRDVSAGGIGLLLARRFEPGTKLAVELTGGPGRHPLRLKTRVVRVEPERAGHWIHGCALTDTLAEDQLKALLNFG